MKIVIKDKKVCENCVRKTCYANNVIQTPNFVGLKTEQFTCPVNLIELGMDEKQLEEGRVDVSIDNKHQCVYCGLCAVQCSQKNLEIVDYKYPTDDDFSSIKDGTIISEPAANKIATSYLNSLYDFSANTNIIKPLLFDGYVCSSDGAECFLEVDVNNDSLECCRRLLADIVTHNHKNKRKIDNGLMVLSDIPKEGSRDVYNQVKSIKKFPNTAHLKMYATTFALLRYYTLNNLGKNIPYKDLFFKIGLESKEEYLERIVNNGYVTQKIAEQIFQN